MNFKIPDLRLPTPEEHRGASLKWLSAVQPTLLDNWPAELSALSMQTKLVRLDVDAVWHALCGLHDGQEMGRALKDLALELDKRLGWDRHFIRLNSRSPKDAPWPFEVPATLSGKEAVGILAGSERVFDDLMEFRWVPEQPAYVCLREFVPWMRPVSEFRCFVKSDDLIAVTHYDYRSPAPTGLAERAGEIRLKIDAYFRDKLKPALHLDTVVFDIAMDHSGNFLLIEINPYGLSDPCWFGSYAAVESARGPIQISNPV